MGKPCPIPRPWCLGEAHSSSLHFPHVTFQSKVDYEVKHQPERNYQVPLALEIEDRGHFGLGCLLAQFESQPYIFLQKQIALPAYFHFVIVSLCDTQVSLFQQCVHVVCVLCSYVWVYLWAIPALSYPFLDPSTFQLRCFSRGTKYTDLTCNVCQLTFEHWWTIVI